MTVAISTFVPSVPGITGVLGSVSATAGYQSLKAKGNDKEIAVVAKTPQVQKETDYFKSALSKMTSVQDLLKDQRAVNYLATSYGLAGATGLQGIIKKVLTQDPADRSSIVNQLSETRWKKMATDLKTFSTGLDTLKGSTTSQTFDVAAIDGQYFQVQKKISTTYGKDVGAPTISGAQNLYSNDLKGLKLSDTGILQTPEGYTVQGLKLDNQGKLQPPLGASLVNSTVTIPDSSGKSTSVNQSFAKQEDGSWKWTVRDGSGTTLSEQSLSLSFLSDGTLSTINGSPVGTGAVSANLAWKDGTTSTQSFDLGSVFKAGFNQYQTDADLRGVQTNWFNNKKTPTQEITPHTVLNGAQPANSTSSYTNVETVPINTPTDGKSPTLEAVTQTLTKNSDGTWNWQIKDSNGNSIYQKTNSALAFDSNGLLKSVDGSITTSPTVTLNWADGHTTSQSFDLQKLFTRSDFSQTVRATDNVGSDLNVRLDYTKTDYSATSWQLKVWNSDTNKLAKTIDLDFSSTGTITQAGKYNTSTGKIESTGTNPLDQTVTMDGGRGYGGSTFHLDLSNISNLGSSNFETRKTDTDSVALGKRKNVSIAQDGTVSATYAKADNSGEVSIDLYRLAVNYFSNAGGLLPSGIGKYLSATNAQAGTNTIKPLGNDKDSSGKAIGGEAGLLKSAPSTTKSVSILETLGKNYSNAVYQQAVGKENPALRYAVYFKQNASNLKSIDALLGDAAARDLVSTVFGIPKEVAKQSLGTQEQIYSRNINIADLQKPAYVDSLINRYLALSDASNGGAGAGKAASNAVTTLFDSSSSDAGSLLSTVSSNINILS